MPRQQKKKVPYSDPQFTAAIAETAAARREAFLAHRGDGKVDGKRGERYPPVSELQSSLHRHDERCRSPMIEPVEAKLTPRPGFRCAVTQRWYPE